MTLRMVLLVTAMLLPSVCPAQDTRGQILGRVTDESGAVIVGAMVRATNIGTNVATHAATNETGDYTLPFLIPGRYNVAVEMEGFRRFLQQNVIVQVDDKVTIDVKLSVGGTTESVQVVADSPIIDVADASMGQVVDSRALMDLPLKDGNPLMLAELAAGVSTFAEGGMSRPFDNSNPSNFAVNGVKAYGSEFSLDGAPNTGGMGGKVAYIPPSGVVSEFKIQTATFDASYGFAPGANVNVSLKNGTNVLHGQFYSFLQNPALNANAFFSNLAGLPKDDYRQNRWGANANGPVVIPRLYDGHNRTFWMYGYEGIRDSLPRGGKGNMYSVPTAAERTGDFSALLAIPGKDYRIFDPATIRVATSTRFERDPFPNNVIPANRLSKTASNILSSYFPQPNLPGTIDGTNNYIIPLLEKNRFMNHLFRVDHAISDKHRIFFRGTANNRYQDYQRRFNSGGGYDYWRNNRGFGIDDVYIFGPQLLLNVRYNYTRYIQVTDPFSVGLDLTTLGFSKRFAGDISAADPRGLMLPYIKIDKLPELNKQKRSDSNNDIHALAFAFTRMHRSHRMQFGGEYRAYRDTNTNLGYSSGELDFSTNWTKGPRDNASASPFGQGLASFMLGLPTGGAIDVNSNYAQQYQVSGWYFQDAWKVSRKLTVNAGLRWEMEVPTTERYNRSIRGFDPAATSPIEAEIKAAYAKSPIPQLASADFHVRGGVVFAGVNGEPRTLWPANKRNLAPRAAIAWQLNERTVVRVGYGMFYDIARQGVNQAGFSRSTDLVASIDTGQTFIASLDNPFPNGFNRPQGAVLGLMTNVGQTISFLSPRLLSPYMQRWQFSVQRRLGRDALAEVAYVGNRGTHLLIDRQVNGTPRQYLSTSLTRDSAANSLLSANKTNPFYPALLGTDLGGATMKVEQLLRPFPQFNGNDGVLARTNEGYSWYHSMQTRFDKRFSRSFTVLGTWTWSKFREATTFLNATDPVPARMISDQDRTHRITATSIYELPFGRGKRWGAGWRGALDKLGAGWQIQGIYRWQTGPPLDWDKDYTTLVTNNTAHDINAIQLPSDQRIVQRWFNTSIFETNSSNKLVYNIRTFPEWLSGIRGMGLNMWDMSAIKNTRLRERVSMQFRAEFINALNHTHFDGPETDPTSTAFGMVTATKQMPRTIQFGLKLTY